MTQIDPEFIKALLAAAESSKAIADACYKVAERLQQEADENKYISPESAAAALGEGISPNMLKQRCTDGRFEHGEHFIDSSDGIRGNYSIKVVAARKFFETPPAKRPPPKRVS